MFSVWQKREIADAVQKVLRESGHPELPSGEIQFDLHVCGAEKWSWADIRNNGAVAEPGVNPHNEAQDAGTQAETKVAQDWMADLQQRARTECKAWDDLAKALGVDLDAPRWNLAGARAVGWARPMGPSRKAMPRCESGGRDYCSCDICF